MNEIEYELKCKECQKLFWTGAEEFCSDSCKELYEYDKEMTSYYRNELKIEDLIHNFNKEEL